MAKWRQFTFIGSIRCNVCIIRFTRHLHGIVSSCRTTSRIQIDVFTSTTNKLKGISKKYASSSHFYCAFGSIWNIMPMEKLLRSIFIFVLTAFRRIYEHFVDSYFVLIKLSAMKWANDERWMARAYDGLLVFISFAHYSTGFLITPTQIDVVKIQIEVFHSCMEILISLIGGGCYI